MSGVARGGETVFVSIDQGGAGTTELIAASGAARYAVVNYVVVMSGAGTVAFSDGTDWLTGDMPFAANGGVAAAYGTQDYPLFVGGQGRPLSITTTGASAHGHMLVRRI